MSYSKAQSGAINMTTNYPLVACLSIWMGAIQLLALYYAAGAIIHRKTLFITQVSSPA